MHLASVSIENFRNLDGLEIDFRGGFNLLVGRNNTGKSNLFQAIRHALGPLASPGEMLWLRREDLTHDGAGRANISDPIRISLTFSGLDESQLAHFFEALDFNPDAPKESNARVHFEADWDEQRGRFRRIRRWGGAVDGERTELPPNILQALPVTFLPALRDATQALAPGRGSRLARLMESIARSRPGKDDADTIVQVFAQANAALVSHELVKTTRERMDERAGMMAGSDFVRSRVGTADPEFTKILKTLRILLEGPTADLTDNGLGYNNLLYIAAVLSHLQEVQKGDVPLLLIEEPEAHLHPQLVQRLPGFFQHHFDDRQPPQTIVATHSPTLAARVKPSQISVLFTEQPGGSVHVNSLAGFGLGDPQERALSRMLDITRASLFFAKGLILVEGVSEELLLPVLAVHNGYDLSTQHISVVPLCGVSFMTLASVLGRKGMGVRVAIVTDGDPPVESNGTDWEKDTPSMTDGHFVTSDRVEKLRRELKDHPTVRVFASQVTLEYDLAAAGPDNSMHMAAVWGHHYPGGRTLTVDKVAAEDSPEGKALVVWRGICRARHGWSKAEFAHVLADEIDQDLKARFTPPQYLRDALRWVSSLPEPPAPSGSPSAA